MDTQSTPVLGCLDGALSSTGAARVSGSKSLFERITGRFYTPDLIAAELADGVAACLARATTPGRRALTIGDPFVGDGRLLVALLTAIAAIPTLAARKLRVAMRDLDGRSVSDACGRVQAAANVLNLRIEVDATVGDSLSEWSPSMHDGLITNPPWELLKPDPRETAGFTAEEAARHLAWLRQRCAELDKRFPEARADCAYAGWGTNLARCGLVLCLRSLRPAGSLGIVMPATLLADQASTTMRRALVRSSRLQRLTIYPAEARLFDRVDQPVATLVATAGLGEGLAQVRHLDAKLRLRTQHDLLWSETAMVGRDFALPVTFGAEHAEDLFTAVAALPTFRSYEEAGAIWAGRELDETRFAEKTDGTGRFPFIKGRMVARHSVVEQPSLSVAPALASRIPSIRHPRLVWRDVARATSRRRMIGAVIPQGWVAGNSLHVAHAHGDEKLLLGLYGAVMSLVFEAQVRARLSTGHMSLGIIRTARLPELRGTDLARLASAARSALDGADEAAISLEVEAARAYGLGRENMVGLLEHFPKINAGEREALLGHPGWGRA